MTALLLIAAALLTLTVAILAWSLARMATLDGRGAQQRDQWEPPSRLDDYDKPTPKDHR